MAFGTQALDQFARLIKHLLLFVSCVFLQVFFPTCRNLLRKFAEFYGIIGVDFYNSSVPDARWLTIETSRSGLPQEFVIVHSDDLRGYMCIDTSVIDDNEESPVRPWTGAPLDDAVIRENSYPDFGNFFLDMLRDDLKGLLAADSTPALAADSAASFMSHSGSSK